MYDLDGNGELDLDEMTKIVQDIYTMQKVYAKLGAEYEKPEKSAVETAKVKFLPYFNFLLVCLAVKWEKYSGCSPAPAVNKGSPEELLDVSMNTYSQRSRP